LAYRERRTKTDHIEYSAATSERLVSAACSVADNRAARAAQQSLYRVRLRARGAGYEPCEVLIACGYAFPPREVPFPVRECTDYKPKRKRSGVEIASEGVVSFPPLDN
jgi:hypothetical protein